MFLSKYKKLFVFYYQLKLAVFLEFFSQRKRDNCKVFIHVNVEEPEISISGQLSAT